tara:strand:- start:131 stop:328 length:198 start_codon:yes stop_codon:yes gene_type:complete
MTTSANQMNITDNKSNNDNSMVDSVKVLSEFTRKDIEKSYNLDTIKGTEAYFSNRYGWTLRRTID